MAFGDIAEAADEAGLDGVFVWDHVLSPVEDQWPILCMGRPLDQLEGGLGPCRLLWFTGRRRARLG